MLVTLTAEPAGPDPVLGILPLPSTGTPNGDGVAPAPVPLSPPQTAPRGLPVYAALSPSGDVLYVLAESGDRVGAVVYAVDPATGALQNSAAVDTGFSDVTALTLGGLAVTADGDLVVGLSLDSRDERAAGGTAAPLLRLTPGLRPSGQVVDAQRGSGRATIVGVAADPAGTVLALVDTTDGLHLVTPDPDAGTATADPLAGEGQRRGGGLAVQGGRAVATLLDLDAPTVAVQGLGGATGSGTLRLCEGSGDALAVAATAEGFLVAGTCNGRTQLWELA